MLQIPGSSANVVDPGTALGALSTMAPIRDPLPPIKRMPKQFVKTQFCKHFLRGYCRYENTCAYAHHDEELMPRPNLQKTKICAKFLAGTCSNEMCTYAHGLTELRFVDRDDAPAGVRNFPPSSCPMNRNLGAQGRDQRGQQHDRQLHRMPTQARQQQAFSQQQVQTPFQQQHQPQPQKQQQQQQQSHQQRSPRQQQQLPYRPLPMHQQQQQAQVCACQMNCGCQGSVEPLPLGPDDQHIEGGVHHNLEQMAVEASTRAAEQVLQMALRSLLQAKPQNVPAVTQGGHASYQQHLQQQQQLPQSFPQMQPTPDASWQHPQQGLQQQVFGQQRPQSFLVAPRQQQQCQLQVFPAAPPTHSREAHPRSQPQCGDLQVSDLGSLAEDVASPSAFGANADVALFHSALTEIVKLLEEENNPESVACESNAPSTRWVSFATAALTAQSKMYMLEGKCLLDHDRRPELSFSNEQSILYLFMRSPHWLSVFPVLARRVTMVLANRLSPDFLAPPGRFVNRNVINRFHDAELYHKSFTCSDLPCVARDSDWS